MKSFSVVLSAAAALRLRSSACDDIVFKCAAGLQTTATPLYKLDECLEQKSDAAACIAGVQHVPGLNGDTSEAFASLFADGTGKPEVRAREVVPQLAAFVRKAARAAAVAEDHANSGEILRCTENDVKHAGYCTMVNARKIVDRKVSAFQRVADSFDVDELDAGIALPTHVAEVEKLCLADSRFKFWTTKDDDKKRCVGLQSLQAAEEVVAAIKDALHTLYVIGGVNEMDLDAMVDDIASEQ